MMAKKLSVVLGLMILAAGCDEGRSPAGPDGAPAPPEPSALLVQHQQGPPTIDEEFAQLARQIPGFGGLFLDETGALTVALVAPAQRARAVQVLAPILAGWTFSTRDKPVDVVNPRVREVRYDFLQLKQWKDRLSGGLDHTGVYGYGIQQSTNRLHILVADGAVRARVFGELAVLGIPRDAVVIEEGSAPEDLSHQTLSSYLRPVRGGIRVSSTSDPDGCSVGFNAAWGFYRTFMTASHCTSKRGGGKDGTAFYQPTVDASFAIDSEIEDPGYFVSGGYYECPWRRKCRWSDAALIGYNSTTGYSLGYIARTTSSLGSVVIADIDSLLTVIGKTQHPIEGQVLDKIGYSTGWTYGGVLMPCYELHIAGSDITYKCQVLFGANSYFGDSGGAVFSLAGGNNLYLSGILQGRVTFGDGSQYTVMGSVPNMERDFAINFQVTPP